MTEHAKSALHQRHPENVEPRRKPWLTIDETTAHITAAAEEVEQLLAWYGNEGIACTLRRQAGIAGLDELDFGDPSPAEEQRIRDLFAAWLGRAR